MLNRRQHTGYNNSDENKTEIHRFLLDIKFEIFDVKILTILVLSVIKSWTIIHYYHEVR